MQQYACMYLLQNHSTCFGLHCTYHQEYIKLQLQPLVQVIVSEQQPSSNVAKFGHVGGKLLLRYYDLYQRLQLQFYVLLMIGAMEPETCRVILQ